jgi:hypothetical protein
LSDDEKLERLKTYAQNGLHYYGSALNRLRSGDWKPPRPVEEEERSLLELMTPLADVVAIVEGAGDEYEMMEARSKIIERFLGLAAADPWMPPAPAP